jgi:hypothetical protein
MKSTSKNTKEAAATAAKKKSVAAVAAPISPVPVLEKTTRNLLNGDRPTYDSLTVDCFDGKRLSVALPQSDAKNEATVLKALRDVGAVLPENVAQAKYVITRLVEAPPLSSGGQIATRWGWFSPGKLYIHNNRWITPSVTGDMAHVFDSTAQSPIDVRLLRVGNYDGLRISNARIKTGVTDAAIPLFPEAKAALDAYLGTRTAVLPESPLFVNDRIGGQWVYSTLCKVHSQIRAAAGLPKKLQLQDFRRTAQTEAGAAGATVDEIRGLARHSTRSAAEHYVHPDERFVNSVQRKRLATRNKTGAKVRMPDK